MDNIFAYLGKLGSEEVLKGKDSQKVIINLFKDCNYTDEYSDNETVSAENVADTVIKNLHNYSFGLVFSKKKDIKEFINGMVLKGLLTKDIILNGTSLFDYDNQEKSGQSQDIVSKAENMLNNLDDPGFLINLISPDGRDKLKNLLNNLVTSIKDRAVSINHYDNILLENAKKCTDTVLRSSSYYISDDVWHMNDSDWLSCEYKNTLFNGVSIPSIKTAKLIYDQSALYKTLSRHEDKFNKAVLPAAYKELHLLMIGNWEYAQSLYRLRIKNGSKGKKSEYISVFDREQRDIKKIVELGKMKLRDSSKVNTLPIIGGALGMATATTTLPIAGSVFGVAAAVGGLAGVLGLTEKDIKKKEEEKRNLFLFNTDLLPQFIRRIYDRKDRGDIIEQANDCKKPIQRNALMHSLYDIGPVLGLIGGHKVKYNPYLLDISDSEPAKGKSLAWTPSVSNFLNNYHCVPFKTGGCDFSAQEVLKKCKTLASANNKSGKELAFLNEVTPEKLSVLGQFMTERFVHGCLLSKAYDCFNGFPAKSYIQYVEAMNRVIEKLMILPMPRTRLYILDYLISFLDEFKPHEGEKKVLPSGKEISFPAPKKFGEEDRSPETALQEWKLLCDGIREFIKVWTEIVIPLHVLYFHFLAISHNLNVETKDFFSKMVNDYNFYEVNEKTERVDVSPQFCTEFNLQSIETLETDGMQKFRPFYQTLDIDVMKKGSPFDEFSKTFYKYFKRETGRICFYYNFEIQLDSYLKGYPQKSLASLSSTEELKKALLFDGWYRNQPFVSLDEGVD